MNDLGLALQMLGVGMITVFIILSFVVLIGNLIIRFVNKYLPEEVAKKIQNAPGQATVFNVFNPKKVAAIVSAVKMVTEGKGHVTKIEKL